MLIKYTSLSNSITSPNNIDANALINITIGSNSMNNTSILLSSKSNDLLHCNINIDASLIRSYVYNYYLACFDAGIRGMKLRFSIHVRVNSIPIKYGIASIHDLVIQSTLISFFVKHNRLDYTYKHILVYIGKHYISTYYKCRFVIYRINVKNNIVVLRLYNITSALNCDRIIRQLRIFKQYHYSIKLNSSPSSSSILVIINCDKFKLLALLINALYYRHNILSSNVVVSYNIKYISSIEPMTYNGHTYVINIIFYKTSLIVIIKL